ncbi:MAG: TldD/PmbA family protein [Clostridia bacterium]|nr:TldD/PmbA family protein [Clostridia bacterium]
MDVNEFIKKLFERAKAAGFEACEADYADNEEFSVGVKNGEIVDYNVSAGMGLGFRALSNGKMGYASTQVLDEDALDLLIAGAAENAALIENEDEEFIFAGSERYPEMDVYNDAIDQITAAEKINMARRLEKACVSIDPRVTQCEEVEIMSGSGARRLVNSRGLDVSYRENYIGLYAGVLAQGEGEVTSGSAIRLARDPKELDIEAEAAKAVKEAVDGLKADKAVSGEYKVILRGDVAGSILRTFASVFSADAAQKGMSLLKGREGEMIGSEALTIVDDPLNPASPGATPFDGEGVAARRLEIVSAGKLNTLLHNLKTAKKQGVQTTGSASKPSYASPVGVSAHSMHIVPSDISPEKLLEMAGDGVLITYVQGLHSGANQISGDFSLGARGFLIEGGKITRPVSQITVAGNFFELMKNVTAVANNLEFTFSSVASPDLLIGKLAVAGK